MDDLRRRVGGLMAEGRKLEAVKLARQELGCSLMQAKQWVEDLEARGVVTAGRVANRGVSDEQLAERARALLQRGQMIQAVKLVRDELGCSLLEAKQWVERLREDPLAAPPQRESDEAVERELQRLLEHGESAQAVRYYRRVRNVEGGTARRDVAAFARRRGLEYRRSGCLTVLLAVLIGAGTVWFAARVQAAADPPPTPDLGNSTAS